MLDLLTQFLDGVIELRRAVNSWGAGLSTIEIGLYAAAASIGLLWLLALRKWLIDWPLNTLNAMVVWLIGMLITLAIILPLSLLRGKGVPGRLTGWLHKLRRRLREMWRARRVWFARGGLEIAFLLYAGLAIIAAAYIFH
ncbi:MAG: hypothetical protein MRY74_13700, partial [Neomegalonema sp.]|nr:hypothetical protein [Neomegalonema sp.]